MAKGDLWRSVQSSLNWAGNDVLAGIAGRNAQTADALQRSREQESAEQKAFLDGVQSRIAAGQTSAEMFVAPLPDGFRPLDKVSALIGQFPTHPDGASLGLPAATAAWIGANRPDVMVKWNQCWFMAAIGHPDSQATLADSLEIGEFGAEPDLIRAFFFFYRAGIQGHTEARKRAEALIDKIGDFQWIIAPPYRVFAGSWQLVQDQFGQAIPTYAFNFEQGGALAGRLADYGGVAGDRLKAMRNHPIGEMSWRAFQDMRFEGRWSYDRASQLVYLHLAGRAPGSAPQAPETICFELMAVKIGSPGEGHTYYGKDEKSFAYYLTFIPA